MNRVASGNRPANKAACIIVGLVSALCAGLVACASSQPVQAVKADFTGGWSVEWCDKTNPKLDCGGFNITLVQEGDRICGDFGGALVNLRQTDEGTIVGTVIGNTAVLAVESNRNGMIALVRAELRGKTLHWKQVDIIKRGGNDIAIIAADSKLKLDTKTLWQPDVQPKTVQTCDSILGRTGANAWSIENSIKKNTTANFAW